MRILLDTNVLIRTIESGHPLRRSSEAAMDRLRFQGHRLVIVPQVLYEIWVVATRPVEVNGLGMSAGEAHTEILRIQKPYRLLLDERAIYPIWEQLVATHGVKGKPAHDARLVAAMLRHSVTHLMTYNTADFERYAEIKAVSPTSVLDGTDLV